MPPSDPLAEVWAALACVNDPELDQSVVDLGFISRVAVQAGVAEISFRLPTFWCSANFAFIMAEDMREAVERLDLVERADVRLIDHYAADQINSGIAAREGFGQAFGAGSGAHLTALRETFRLKAFYGRMSELIEALRQHGRSDRAILDMRIADLTASREDPLLARLAGRYLELRAVYGGPHSPTDAAFRLAEGAAIEEAALSRHLRDLRMSRRSAEANGEMCRMLLKARFGEAGQGAPQPVPVAPAGSRG